MNLTRQSKRPGLVSLLFCSACGLTPAIINTYISSAATVFCPDVTVIPAGATVCSDVAQIVEVFIEDFASGSTKRGVALGSAYSQAAMKAAIAQSAMGGPMVRIGSYGYFPAPIAAVLSSPAVAQQLDAYVASFVPDAGASARR